jgi:hypothetical protein
MRSKFLPKLEGYLSQPDLPEENEDLRQRMEKAGSYFSWKPEEELLPEAGNIKLVTDDHAIVKTAREYLTILAEAILAKLAGFKACRPGFSADSLARAKTNAELDALKKGIAAKGTSRVLSDDPKDVRHPDLYARLLRWRDNAAAKFDVEPHQVLPTRPLEELVRHLPTGIASLKKIRGIDRSKVKKYGASILAIIKSYCIEKDLSASPQQSAPPTRTSSKLDKNPSAWTSTRPDKPSTRLPWNATGNRKPSKDISHISLPAVTSMH